jgi:hypothetical protein
MSVQLPKKTYQKAKIQIASPQGGKNQQFLSSNSKIFPTEFSPPNQCKISPFPKDDMTFLEDLEKHIHNSMLEPTSLFSMNEFNEVPTQIQTERLLPSRNTKVSFHSTESTLSPQISFSIDIHHTPDAIKIKPFSPFLKNADPTQTTAHNLILKKSIKNLNKLPCFTTKHLSPRMPELHHHHKHKEAKYLKQTLISPSTHTQTPANERIQSISPHKLHQLHSFTTNQSQFSTHNINNTQKIHIPSCKPIKKGVEFQKHQKILKNNYFSNFGNYNCPILNEINEKQNASEFGKSGQNKFGMQNVKDKENIQAISRKYVTVSPIIKEIEPSPRVCLKQINPSFNNSRCAKRTEPNKKALNSNDLVLKLLHDKTDKSKAHNGDSNKKSHRKKGKKHAKKESENVDFDEGNEINKICISTCHLIKQKNYSVVSDTCKSSRLISPSMNKTKTFIQKNLKLTKTQHDLIEDESETLNKKIPLFLLSRSSLSQKNEQINTSKPKWDISTKYSKIIKKGQKYSKNCKLNTQSKDTIKKPHKTKPPNSKTFLTLKDQTQSQRDSTSKNENQKPNPTFKSKSSLKSYSKSKPKEKDYEKDKDKENGKEKRKRELELELEKEGETKYGSVSERERNSNLVMNWRNDICEAQAMTHRTHSSKPSIHNPAVFNKPKLQCHYKYNIHSSHLPTPNIHTNPSSIQSRKYGHFNVNLSPNPCSRDNLNQLPQNIMCGPSNISSHFKCPSNFRNKSHFANHFIILFQNFADNAFQEQELDNVLILNLREFLDFQSYYALLRTCRMIYSKKRVKEKIVLILQNGIDNTCRAKYWKNRSLHYAKKAKREEKNQFVFSNNTQSIDHIENDTLSAVEEFSVDDLNDFAQISLEQSNYGSRNETVQKGLYYMDSTWNLNINSMSSSGLKPRRNTGYAYFKSRVSDCLPEIEKDVDRTFLSHETFSNKKKNLRDNEQKKNMIKKLSEVLNAFSNKNPQIGYIQGINFIAGHLLTVLNEEVNLFIHLFIYL